MKQSINNKETKINTYKENKGNWEYSFFQKKFEPNEEANIKLLLCPDAGFNPALIHTYINNTLSKEELIVEKKKNNIKLSKTEDMIYKNYIEKKNKLINDELLAIKIQGLNAKPETKIGKTALLLKTLNYFLEKDNNEAIANIYLKLMEDNYDITDELRKEYENDINKMNKIVKELDIIELQFCKFYGQMPPLNIKGFKKLDEWQINVINNIDNNISTIINAPTSAGKSVLSGYVVNKGKCLFVVPTNALAWQMSAYIGKIINQNVPILTNTYQSNPSRDEMINIINTSSALVGTANAILDYLPLININFKWVIFDEVHMIGKQEGMDMEPLLKVLKNIPILALSATINNTDEIVEWMRNISPEQRIEKVICSKRFFNLQRYNYDVLNNELVFLHPLSLIEEYQIKDKSILNKNLQPTPIDIWDLSIKLKDNFDLGDLEPHKYFDREVRIELNDANVYFYKLLEFIVLKYETNNEKIIKIINSYKLDKLEINNPDLLKLVFKLKENNKLPAIIFQNDTLSCLNLARDFAKKVDQEEDKKYPTLFQDRLKLIKLAKRMDKHVKEDKEDNAKKELKQIMGTLKLKKDGYGQSSISIVKQNVIETVPLQEPHSDFNFNDNQYFSESTVEGWVSLLKKYFPNTGEYYHYIIKLLWRGIGIYANGLPEPYLRLVQTLASQKKLAIVFSDKSLVFGVSMPFRSVIIIKEDNEIDSMLYHQMSGRAGRRGLDKEGNVIFAGYSWDKIKELSISESPNIIGYNNNIYNIDSAVELSKNNNSLNWDNINKNFLDARNSYIIIKNINKNDDYNFLYMNWKLRNSNDCIIISLLIPYLKQGFSNKDHENELNQIQLAHFLCSFISIEESKDNILETPSMLSNAPFYNIKPKLIELNIIIPNNISNKLFISIQNNKLIEETDKLRNDLTELSDKIKNIQHYCYHTKNVGLTKILGKLLTRIWWIHHTSSPIMKPLTVYEN